MPPPPGANKPRSHINRRRRGLRRTLITLSVVLLGGGGVFGIIVLLNRTPTYKPGEENADVTSSLTQQLPGQAPQPRFADATASAGLGDFKTFAGERTSQLPEDMGPGLAWGDFDNDGDDDLFLVSAGGSLALPANDLLPSKLYENLGDGRFKVADGFPELRLRGLGAAWGDYDADGYLDLAISGYNQLLLFHNEPANAGRQFTASPALPNQPGFWSGLAWADFDHDRDLDLYVCNYVRYSENPIDAKKGSDQLGTFVPFTLNPASYPPGKNLLLQNDGAGGFVNVADALGVANEQGRSLGALWHDFDEDGWLDLYVANDISDNVFYRNTGAGFEDISHAAWVADYRSAMGLAAGDYDRDGDDDLFITHWVAQENALYENAWGDFNLPNHPASATDTPSSTPTNSSEQTYKIRFVDVNEMKGLGQIALPAVGWGTEFVDIDSDGWLDLIVANGNTIETSGPPPKTLQAQAPFLFWNRRSEFFHDLAPYHPLLQQPHVSRGLAVADYDLDGDLDLAVTHLGEGVQLLQNEIKQGNWIKLRLRSRNAAGQPLGFGDGSKVIVRAGEANLRRTVSSVSYLSQSSRVLHFGLGDSSSVDEIEVRWSAGATNRFQNLGANQTWELTEGDPLPRAIPPPSPRSTPSAQPGTDTPLSERQRTLQFWTHQRAAMNALKVDQNIPEAIRRFQQALALNPRHEDSLYYLAQCLAQENKIEEALGYLDTLARINPQSQRAFQQWGMLRALSHRNADDLNQAHTALEKAHQINPEETGALLALGEVTLMRGQSRQAETHFNAACQSNPRAAGGFFLLGYIAWKNSDTEQARLRLTQARQALGEDWQPHGATSEGDVQQKHHLETSPLALFWQNWNGTPDPDNSFSALDRHLQAIARRTPQN